MYKASELNDLGKQLATSYLQDGQNLTAHLQKVASDRGLTKPQVDRVAEVANVETYLNLMKTADNHYIEFDVADPTSIKVDKQIKKSAAIVDDYEAAPEYEFSLESYFGTDLEEKQAEDKAAIRKYAQELQGKIEYLNNRLAEAATTYEWNVGKFAQQIKQAHLRDQADLDKIHYITKEAAKHSSDHFWPIVESKLQYWGLSSPKEYSSFDANINTQSSIYKSAADLENQLIKLAKIKSAVDTYASQWKQTNLYSDHIAYGLEKVGGMVSSTIEFIGEHPVLSSSAVVGALGYAAGKSKGRREQGEILREEFVDVKGNKTRRGV